MDFWSLVVVGEAAAYGVTMWEEQLESLPLPLSALPFFSQAVILVRDRVTLHFYLLWTGMEPQI